MSRDNVTQEYARLSSHEVDMGFVSFNTTGTAVAIKTNLSKIKYASFGFVDAGASTDAPFTIASPTISSDGFDVVAGEIVVSRAAGTTSNLKIFYFLAGY